MAEPGQDLFGFGAQLRREVDEFVRVHALAVEGRRPRGEGLRGRGRFAGHVALRDGPVLDRPHGLSRPAVEDEREGLLGEQRDGRNGAPADDQVGQDRGRGRIVVPDAVTDRLVVPHPRAGAGVKRDDALRKEVVPRAVPAIVVVRPRFDRQVHESKLGVGAERGPHSGVARVLPRSVLPGLVAELAGPGDGVEGPQQRAGHGVVSANVPGRHLARARRASRRHRGAHHDHVAHHHGRRAGPDRRPLEVDLAAKIASQVHDSVVAEILDRQARRGVESHQMVARTDHEDSRRHAVRLPPGYAPAGVPSRRRPVPFVEPVRPERLSSPGVDGRHGAPVPRRRVENAVHHERRGAVVELGRRSVVVRPPAPHHLEIAHVAGVDLRERGVARATGVAPVVAPLPVRRSLLGLGGGRPQADHQHRGHAGRRSRVGNMRAHVQAPCPDGGLVRARGPASLLAR